MFGTVGGLFVCDGFGGAGVGSKTILVGINIEVKESVEIGFSGSVDVAGGGGGVDVGGV